MAAAWPATVADDRIARLAELPDKPHPLDTYRLADAATAAAWRLRAALP